MLPEVVGTHVHNLVTTCDATSTRYRLQCKEKIKTLMKDLV